MRTVTWLIFSLFVSPSLFAQKSDASISGVVKDIRNETIVGATVSLFNNIDSTVMATQVSDKAGRFSFIQLTDASYRLLVTSVAHKPFQSDWLQIDSAHRRIILPAIILNHRKSTDLEAVVVTAKRPLIEQEVDKTIVNVGSMISSATSNALEVLEKTPGVTITTAGEISLNGRSGILVLIDGKQTYMSAADIAAYLKSIPGSLIDKIELIDNPSARYDAAGNAIINLKLKRNRIAGTTGSISIGYSHGKLARTNDAISINHNHKKLNLFASVGYNNEKNYTDERYERIFYTPLDEVRSSLSMVNNYRSKGGALNTNLGIDYQLSEQTTYGLQFLLNNSRRNAWSKYSSNSFNAYKELDTSGAGEVNSAGNRNNVGVNGNLLHKFRKPREELSVDVNFLQYHTLEDQSLQNFLYRPADVITSHEEFAYFLPSDVHIYSAKVDYVLPLENKSRFESGFKSSRVDHNNPSNYYAVNGTVLTIDNMKSNHFKYHENIHAAYFNIQKTWKRLAAQTGLRVEHTSAVGEQLGNEIVNRSTFTKNYTEWFPALFLNYKLDTTGKNSLNLSITRRINRPNYQSFNPFIFFRDNYSYSSGNPYLTPQYQFRYEMRYIHKQWLRVTFSYNRFKDVIFTTTEARDNLFISKPQNLERGFMLLLNTGLSLSPVKGWKVNTDLLLSHMGINGVAYSEKLTRRAYVARINLLNQVAFNKKVSGEFGGYYASMDLNGQSVTKGMFRAQASMQMKMLKEKASIRLSVDDIFHSWVYHNSSFALKQAAFQQSSESDTRRIGIAFTYRFGNENFARKRRQTENASDEEKGRVQ